MRRWMLVAAVVVTTAAWGEQAEVAIVKATFSLAERPGEGRGSLQFSRTIEMALEQAGVAFDMLTEEEVEERGLAGYKLVIFPYSAVWHERETQRTVEYLQDGGKVMCFYTVPAAVLKLLGVASAPGRRENYEGEFREMRFTDDRPPGFPAAVHQVSGNSAVPVVGEGGRVLATWYDSAGQSTGVPAVILSDNGVFVSHVFHNGNSAEQGLLTLATLGHFVPGSWQRIIEGILAQAAPVAGYESMDALVRSVAERPTASRWAKQAVALQSQARTALGEQQYEQALTLARQAQEAAQRAVASSFPSRPYELRGAWMGMPGDDTDWEAIMSELEAANFNAIFPLVCDGTSAVYPSAYLQQVTRTDQLAACLEAAHRHGIEVHPWRVNWCCLRASDQEQQALVDAGLMVVAVGQPRGEDPNEASYHWTRTWRDPSAEVNRELEFNVMTELVEKYDVDGIHFDYMRYPSKYYCYCDRCRQMFEQWAGVRVERWPDDCWEGGKYLKAYRDWRRMLQTSLVARIAERARALNPNIKVSLAARASVTGAPEDDGQDWPTWAHAHYLDMLCPMDYTSSVEVLRAKLQPQMEVIDGAIPVYAGIGVGPTRSNSPINLSEQIMAARELGADGFLLFSLTGFTRAMLPAIADGATSEPVTIMPHHTQPVEVAFRYPDGIAGGPERTYQPGASLRVGVSVRALPEDATGLAVEMLAMPAVGGVPLEAPVKSTVNRTSYRGVLAVSGPPGVYQVIVRGEVIAGDKHQAFYARSRPLRVLTTQETAELLARLHPPVFTSARPHLGIAANGYGSEGIAALLEGQQEFEVQKIYQITPQFLAGCDVVLLAQPRDGPNSLDVSAIAALRDFVRAGGGLLVTHDAVGNRGHPALFPEVAQGGGTPVRSRTVLPRDQHPIVMGIAREGFEHSYYDHIPLIPGEAGVVLAVDASNNPVVVAGTVGQGRYVAWGMCTGLAEADTEMAPGAGEAAMLLNALRWLSQ